jgi:hypothetical protein
VRTLYRASLVRTFGHPATGEWLLVDGRHIERVGVGEPAAADRVVELPGATITPGFTDAHVHLASTGVHLGRPEAAAAPDAAGLLAAAVATTPGTAGIVFLHGYDESKWTDRTPPSIGDLDGVPHPLVLARADSHAALVNNAALIQSGAADLPGVERDEHGAPTGVLSRQANDRVLQWYTDSLSAGEIEEFQLDAAALASSRGVTTVHEMSMPRAHGTRELDVLLGHRGRLPVDVVTYVATMELGEVLDRGLPRIGGDLALDGSLGARTARMSEDYVDAASRGVAYFEDDALVGFLRDAHVAGLQVGLHAIGDAAIEQAISSWERVYSALDSRERRHFRARRHRIEHFECTRPGHVERAAMLGLCASVQPNFDAEWGRAGALYEQRLGESRAYAMNPFRTLVERGMVVGTGTDSPITELDPALTIQALESHHDPAQRMDREAAFRLCTSGGAQLARQEDKKGRLEAGAHADFAAFDVDPLDGTEDLSRPMLTVSLGREVHAS